MANEDVRTEALGPTYLIHSFEHRAYPLPTNRPFTIGRDAGCDIMVNEVSVSRHHAEVRLEDGSHTLYPVGSTPTFLNELPLEAPHPLHEGETFAVGTMKFVFTSKRLPAAMAVAKPMQRVLSGVDDKRPTLTFPLQGSSTAKKDGPQTVWIVLAVAVVVGAIFLYNVM